MGNKGNREEQEQGNKGNRRTKGTGEQGGRRKTREIRGQAGQ